MRNALKHWLSGLAVLSAMLSLPAHAVRNTGGEYNTLYAGLGAHGYDVVAYFTDGKPVQGIKEHAFQYGGVTWQFASDEHRDLFAANPAKYAPQYGGFCSWGVANGKLFEVDPVNGWTVYNNKLYLNFNGDINKTFAADAGKLVRDAERNWPQLNK